MSPLYVQRGTAAWDANERRRTALGRQLVRLARRLVIAGATAAVAWEVQPWL